MNTLKKTSKITVLIVLMTLMCSGCAVKEKEKKVQETTEEEVYGYTARYGTYETNDGSGWLYVMEISYVGEKTKYNFEGINEKYTSLDGFTIKVYDEYGEVDYELEPGGAVAMGYDDKYDKELTVIDNFLEQKKFTEPISLEDLEELKLEKIEKEGIVAAFNEAITSSERTEFGPLANHPYANLYRSKVKDGKQWLVFVLSSYGYAQKVKIDYVSDGEYLSDKERANTLTKDEKKLNKDMKAIEQWMMEANTFDLKKYEGKLKTKKGKELINYISVMYEEDEEE